MAHSSSALHPGRLLPDQAACFEISESRVVILISAAVLPESSVTPRSSDDETCGLGKIPFFRLTLDEGSKFSTNCLVPPTFSTESTVSGQTHNVASQTTPLDRLTKLRTIDSRRNGYTFFGLARLLSTVAGHDSMGLVEPNVPATTSELRELGFLEHCLISA